MGFGISFGLRVYFSNDVVFLMIVPHPNKKR
jgi:hypothetical protein